MNNRNFLLILAVLFGPTGIHRLYMQNLVGWLQMSLFYLAYLLYNSQFIVVERMSYIIILMALYMYIMDISIIYNNKLFGKDWKKIYKIIFFVFGLVFSLLLMLFLRFFMGFSQITPFTKASGII